MVCCIYTLYFCRFQYQVQRYDKSNARTSFGDLKSKLFLGLLFSSILIFRICLSSTSLNEVPLGMYCQMKRIRLSHDTGWEARYGIYLDDGWYYVYRSEILLNRFLIEPATENTYCISRVQYCRNHPQGKTYQALIEALWEDGLDMSDCSQYDA